MKRFEMLDDFFEAIKYRDFARFYIEDKVSKDIGSLHRGFNLINKTITSMDTERQAQFLYLQKILQMVDIGIIAYNIESGQVLWQNDSLLKILDLPIFKNISFLKKRRPQVYDELFETYHSTPAAAMVELPQEELKVLISDTIFEIGANSYKLVMIQNIEETLNKNESEAWKKLLGVMAHEIMNSIAPISSLAETLENDIKNWRGETLNKHDISDLKIGLASIRKRSEGLLQFAKTYRSLSKITHIIKEPIKAVDLLANIDQLMKPIMVQKKIRFSLESTDPNLKLQIDSYLIEQVIINLLLNAIEAVSHIKNPVISVQAVAELNKNNEIKIIDNGAGIPADIIDNVFIPFFSTKKLGSGIGLSLSKQIMLLHGGKIQIRSQENKGTIVSLIFH